MAVEVDENEDIDELMMMILWRGGSWGSEKILSPHLGI